MAIISNTFPRSEAMVSHFRTTLSALITLYVHYHIPHLGHILEVLLVIYRLIGRTSEKNESPTFRSRRPGAGSSSRLISLHRIRALG